MILLLNIFVSTVTMFFGPAEAAMIPFLVPRSQLLAANGIFTLTLNAAFALGFALLGPLVVTIAGPQALILIVARLLPHRRRLLLHAAADADAETARGRRRPRRRSPTRSRPSGRRSASCARASATSGSNRTIGWSLVYLGITASLIGVLGVLGPAFATDALGLAPKDFVVVVLPLGLRDRDRDPAAEQLRPATSRAGGSSRAASSRSASCSCLLVDRGPDRALPAAVSDAPGARSTCRSSPRSLSVVVAIAFLAGIAYAFVAIPSQTQLQEDLPEDVRGRVFGILNMLVSVASFLPIIIVGPIADSSARRASSSGWRSFSPASESSRSSCAGRARPRTSARRRRPSRSR